MLKLFKYNTVQNTACCLMVAGQYIDSVCFGQINGTVRFSEYYQILYESKLRITYKTNNSIYTT